MITKNKGRIIILLISIIVLLSPNSFADLYLNSKTGYINLNTTGQTRMQITPGGNLDLLGIANVSIPGNLSVGGNVSVDNSTLFVDAQNNRVGVGTNSPDVKLEVILRSGGALTAGSDSNIARFRNDAETTDRAIITILSGSAETSNIYMGDKDNDDIGFVRYDNANNRMQFATNAGFRMTIDSSGDVGIGTAEPGEDLDIKSTAPELRFNDSDNSNFFDLGMSGTDFKIYSNDTSARGMTISQSGKVGIGTTAPGALLHVEGQDNYAGLFINNTGGENWRIQSWSDGKLYFSNSSTDLIVFDRGGKVGIGTASPSVKLDVQVSESSAAEVARFQNTGSADQSFIFFPRPSSLSRGLIIGHQFPSQGDYANASYIRATSAVSQGIEIQAGNDTTPKRGDLILQPEGGSVGIGTTSPVSKLDVRSGNITIYDISDDRPTLRFVDSGGSERGTIWIGNGAAEDEDSLYIQGGGEEYIYFKDSDETFMVVGGASGHVGIGTMQPSQLLNYDGTEYSKIVNINGSATGNTALAIAGGDARITMLDQNGEADDRWMEIAFDNKILRFAGLTDSGSSSTDNILVLNVSSGNVGIGTIGPKEKLEVSNAIRVSGTGGVATTNDGTWGAIDFASGLTGGGMRLLSFGATTNVPGAIEFYQAGLGNTAARTAMVISTAGRVGIGTTGPNVLLDLNDSTASDNSIMEISGSTGTRVAGFRNYVMGGDVDRVGLFMSDNAAEIRMWFDDTGDLLINDGADPTTDQDGTVVGSQSFTGKHIFEFDEDTKTASHGDAVIINKKGKIEISSKENDPRVIGLFMGKAKKDKDSFGKEVTQGYNVAAIGDTFDTAYNNKLRGAKVCNSNGNITIGDLLATSKIHGCLQKQDDDLIHSYTIGKAAEISEFDENGVDYIHMFIYSG